jgi:signal transduction histidine kinase
VQLRWLAIFIALTLVLVTGNVLDILPKEVRSPLLFCILLLAMCNLAFWHLSRNSSHPYQLILVQTILDLFFLTLFLHFSGGLENPLFILYTLHIIIAGILMTPRACYLITTMAVALLSFMAVGECTGILAHHTIDRLDHTVYGPLSVGIHLLSFTGILFLTAYFTTLIMGQLRKSQLQLCRAGKLVALGEIVGQIAHEVNNPIAIISTKAKLLTSRLKEVSYSESRINLPKVENPKGPPSVGGTPSLGWEDASGMSCTIEKVLRDLQKIDTHAERIASITKGLLAFCRPSAEKKTIIDANQAVRATLRLLDRPALNGLSFRINLTEKPLWIYGNFNELQQVILNIINNAIDAMPDGGQLEVTTLTQDNSAIISLTDSGVGISPGDIDLIFDPFFTTKPEGKGTGLGLSISHGIVQDHGGHIDVESTLGRGSTFTIKLPLRVKEFSQ